MGSSSSPSSLAETVVGGRWTRRRHVGGMMRGDDGSDCFPGSTQVTAAASRAIPRYSGADIPGGMRAKAVTRVTSSTCPPPTAAAAPPRRAILPDLRDPGSPTRAHVGGDIHSPRSTRQGLVSHRKVLPLSSIRHLYLIRPPRKTNPQH